MIWRARIAFMLCTCDAAVVLLDDNAIRSSWVLAETIYLSARADYTPEQSPPFRLFPISLVPLRAYQSLVKEVLGDHRSYRRRSWDVADLRRLQFASGTDADSIARSILAELREVITGFDSAETPAERLAMQLQGLLATVADATLLERLADTLMPNVSWRSRSVAARAALALIRSLVAGEPMAAVRHMLDNLGYGLTDDNMLRILKHLCRFDLMLLRRLNYVFVHQVTPPDAPGCRHANHVLLYRRTLSWPTCRTNLRRSCT